MPRPRLTAQQKKDRKMFTFLITPALLAGLNQVEQNEGISKSEQARRAIQQWLADRNAISSTSATSKPATRRRAKP